MCTVACASYRSANSSGIGPIAEKRLRSLGITTVGHLQDAPLALLATAFPTGSAALKELAFGGSSAAVHAGHQAPKSLGHEVTFAEDIRDPELLGATLLDLSDQVMADLRGEGYLARTVVLKLRYESFHTITRQVTLPAPTGSTRPVYEAAVGLLGGLDLRARRSPARGQREQPLVGRCSAQPGRSWREVALNEAVDRVRAKYGGTSLRLAASELTPYLRRTASPGEAADPDSS